METITIHTDGGSIEVRTGYTTGGNRLASGALSANFDRLKVEDEAAYAYLDSEIVSSIEADDSTLERTAAFLLRHGDADVEFDA